MATLGSMKIPIYTKLGRKKYHLGTYTLDVNVEPDENGNITLTPGIKSFTRALEKLFEPTVTERLLDGEKILVIGPTLSRSMDFIAEVTESLQATGHHVTGNGLRASLDDGGELQAHSNNPFTFAGCTADHVVILGAVPDEHVAPILATTNGTISRR